MEGGSSADGSFLMPSSYVCPARSGTPEFMFLMAWMPSESLFECFHALIAQCIARACKRTRMDAQRLIAVYAGCLQIVLTNNSDVRSGVELHLQHK